MTERKRIIILGGGFAGAFTARHLTKLVGKSCDIELISDRNYFVFQPLLPEVAAGTINAQDAVTPLRLLLKDTHVRLGEVCEVDFQQQRVRIAQGSRRIPAYRDYDHLVIALGQRTILDRFEGFAQHSFCLRDLSNAHELRNHVIQCLEHADVTENDELRQRLLTFVVAGGGFSGVEIAGELHEMLDRTLHLYPRLKREQVRTILIQRGQRILPELPEQLGKYAAKQLTRYGVDIRFGTSLKRATGTAVYTEGGECIGSHTLITTIGNGPTTLVEQMQLPMHRGRIQTNSYLQVEGCHNVWAVGDVAAIPIDDPDTQADAATPTQAPTTAQFAVQEAKTLAHNITASLNNQTMQPFAYAPKGTMASVGHYRAVAQVFGMHISGLLAWLLWRAFYIGMLPGFSTRLRVALNWLFDYFLPRSIVQVKTQTGHGARMVHYAKGDVLFAPGQIVDGFYIIANGSLESRVPLSADAQDISGVPSPSTPNRVDEDFVRILGVGDHWGERSLAEDSRTQGTLTALEDCQVLVLPRDDFAKLRDGLPPVQDYLANIPEKIYPPSLRPNNNSADTGVSE